MPRLPLIQIRLRSYASRNQLAVSAAEMNAGVELEWDRRFRTVLGVAGNRLYEFRLQTSETTYQSDKVRTVGFDRGVFVVNETPTVEVSAGGSFAGLLHATPSCPCGAWCGRAPERDWQAPACMVGSLHTMCPLNTRVCVDNGKLLQLQKAQGHSPRDDVVQASCMRDIGSNGPSG